jgi:hypothetical protein
MSCFLHYHLSLPVLPTEAELRGKKAIQFQGDFAGPTTNHFAILCSINRTWYQQDTISSRLVSIHWPQLNIIETARKFAARRGCFFVCLRSGEGEVITHANYENHNNEDEKEIGAVRRRHYGAEPVDGSAFAGKRGDIGAVIYR